MKITYPHDMEKNLHSDIVILGAGIGGYETFRRLTKLLKKYRRREKILLIDRNNYFTFTPMLHEAAAGSIEPDHAAIPIRELIYKTGHSFLKADVRRIDPEKKVIFTSEGDVGYGYAVVALGSGVNYFGTPGAAEHAHQVRTLTGAMRLRTRLFTLLEEGDAELSITIVGGGYTGVEVAGQFVHLINHDVSKLYPEKRVTLTLVEAGKELVPTAPELVRRRIRERLEQQGVVFRLGSALDEVAADRVKLKNGQAFPSDLVIWCAGISFTADRWLAAPWQEKGQIPVNEFLQSPSAPTLYAVGDTALFRNAGSAEPCPPLGEVAHREGSYVARHIMASILKKNITPFHFSSLGLLIPIGDWWGVLISGRFILFGRLAWWLRRTVYVHFMPGFIRKLKIILDWTLHGLGFRYILELEEGKIEKSKSKVMGSRLGRDKFIKS